MRLTLLIVGLFVVVNAATAITVQGTPPAAPAAAKSKAFVSTQATTVQHEDSSGLRRGTIEAIDIAGSTFHVYGQGLNFDAQQVKVFGRNGKPASIYSVRKNSAVRFTLDPNDPLHRRVAVIYLD